jgi:hypothetical protein
MMFKLRLAKEHQMANIDQELRLANEARVAIAKKPREILEILRTAAFVAQAH